MADAYATSFDIQQSTAGINSLKK